MKILYICERTYTLYRTLVKAVNSIDEMDIVLTETVESMSSIYDELIKSGLFANVYLFDELTHRSPSHLIKFKGIFSIKKFADVKVIVEKICLIVKSFLDFLASQRKAKKITLPIGLDLSKYDEIHITDCSSILNFYLYSKKFKNLVYVEHAKNALSGKYLLITHMMNVLAKLRIIHGILGSYRYMKAIEVSENKNLIPEVRKKEIRELSIDKLVSDLSPEQGEFVYQLYAKSSNLVFPYDTSAVDFFLTTYIPGLDYLTISVQLCEYVIADYMEDADYIMIKPHPFDKTDYKELCSKYKSIRIIPSFIPSEVFSLSSTLKIRKLININSTSAYLFNNAAEHVTLGIEYITSKGLM